MTTLNLITPPAAQTSDSIALLWDKIRSAKVESYDVYVDGQLVTSTPHTDCTLRNLAPAREYSVRIAAKITGGDPIQSNTLRVSTKPAPRVFDITAYGALGDGKTLNTKAIQSAIDACNAGGCVRIPAGTFMSGAIFLKSDMTLFLDAGAILLGSPDTKDYPVFTYRSEGREKPCHASLINSANAPDNARLRNITVAGTGIIDGNGVALFHNTMKDKLAERGRVLCIRNTDGVYIQGITLRNSPFWCLHPIYCTGVSINAVTIKTRLDEHGNKYAIHNNDGIDPDSCKDVFIFDCDIFSQDDCIALKSGRDADGRAVGIATENVRITHCRFHSGFGVACGSEMSGGVRNVLVEDCDFKNTFSIASVKAPRGRGSVIENVTYRDCTLKNTDPEIKETKWFRGAIYVDYFYGQNEIDMTPKPRDDGTPIMHHLRFENITLDTIEGHAVYLHGLPESPVKDVVMQNIQAIGKHGFLANTVQGLTLENVNVTAREGAARTFSNVESLSEK